MIGKISYGIKVLPKEFVIRFEQRSSINSHGKNKYPAENLHVQGKFP